MAVFSEAFLRLRQDLDQSHENRRKLLDDIRASVQEMARNTGRDLKEQGENRRTEFAAMIGDLRDKIRQQADQTRRQLAELSDDLHQGGQTFARRTTPRRQPATKR